MKYTICREGEFLANEENKRILFDSREEAKDFKVKNKIDAHVMGYMDKDKMKYAGGWKAWDLFNSGTEVYTKIFGLDWVLCEKGKWSISDFTCGHFDFYINSNP